MTTKCSAEKKAKCRSKQKVCNPKTGRCIKIGGSVYKKVFPHGHGNARSVMALRPVPVLAVSTLASSKCSSAKKAKCRSKQKVCNPKTGRCIKIGGSVYKKVFPKGHSCARTSRMRQTPPATKSCATKSVPASLKKTKYYADVYRHMRSIGLFPQRQLGKEGKDGYVIEVHDNQGHALAAKIFRMKKSSKMITKEYRLQEVAARLGVSPAVRGMYVSPTHKYFVMDKLDVTYGALLKAGTITKADVQQIFKCFVSLAQAGLNVNDPNVKSNIMKKGNRWYIIDFGFAKQSASPHAGMTLVPRVFQDIKNPVIAKYAQILIDRYEESHKVRLDIRRWARLKRSNHPYVNYPIAK